MDRRGFLKLGSVAFAGAVGIGLGKMVYASPSQPLDDVVNWFVSDPLQTRVEERYGIAITGQATRENLHDLVIAIEEARETWAMTPVHLREASEICLKTVGPTQRYGGSVHPETGIVSLNVIDARTLVHELGHIHHHALAHESEFNRDWRSCGSYPELPSGNSYVAIFPNRRTRSEFDSPLDAFWNGMRKDPDFQVPSRQLAEQVAFMVDDAHAWNAIVRAGERGGCRSIEFPQGNPYKGTRARRYLDLLAHSGFLSREEAARVRQVYLGSSRILLRG